MASTGIHRYSGDESANVSLNQLGFDMLSITSNFSNLAPNDAHEAKVAYGGVWKKLDSLIDVDATTVGDNTLIFDDASTSYGLAIGDYLGINDEIVQVAGAPSATQALAITRAHFGTIEAEHAVDTQIWYYTRVGEWFKFWTSIYNVSEFSGSGLQLEIQTKPYDSFDSEVCHSSYDVSANVNFISLAI